VKTTVFHPSEVELTTVSQLLMQEMRKVGLSRVVFDSLSAFRLMAETPSVRWLRTAMLSARNSKL
jgi:circadian clock protein KaiC